MSYNAKLESSTAQGRDRDLPIYLYIIIVKVNNRSKEHSPNRGGPLGGRWESNLGFKSARRLARGRERNGFSTKTVMSRDFNDMKVCTLFPIAELTLPGRTPEDRKGGGTERCEMILQELCDTQPRRETGAEIVDRLLTIGTEKEKRRQATRAFQ